MALLGVDVGTTHCKAALFSRAGEMVRRSSRATPTTRGGDGTATHDPDLLWAAVSGVIRDAARDDSIDVVGVASMAEAGLLLDVETGKPRTEILAWFDTRATTHAEELTRREGAPALFHRSGLHSSFKFGLPKLLWLEERHPGITQGAVWLSVADYVAYRLSGARATDPTLAARTFAYSILEGWWDEAWIERVGLNPGVFPPVVPSGQPIGTVHGPGARESGLSRDTPVSVCGHDHICSLLAVGIVGPGSLLDSIGTAESLIAVADGPQHGEDALLSGLALVPHVLPGRWCWLGGLSAAGGSLEWLRRVIGDPSISYDEMQAEVEALGEAPTGILYYPYLLGSGAPLPDRRVRGAFVGLAAGHRRGHLIKAVLEGVALEAESVRRAIEQMAATAIREVAAVGGGTRSASWMQIRADVLGCDHHVSPVAEATSLGAALAAGLGSHTLSGVDDVLEIAAHHRKAGHVVRPHREWHELYRAIYEGPYLALQAPLRTQSATLGRVTGDRTPSPSAAGSSS